MTYIFDYEYRREQDIEDKVKMDIELDRIAKIKEEHESKNNS